MPARGLNRGKAPSQGQELGAQPSGSEVGVRALNQTTGFDTTNDAAPYTHLLEQDKSSFSNHMAWLASFQAQITLYSSLGVKQPGFDSPTGFPYACGNAIAPVIEQYHRLSDVLCRRQRPKASALRVTRSADRVACLSRYDGESMSTYICDVDEQGCTSCSQFAGTASSQKSKEVNAGGTETICP